MGKLRFAYHSHSLSCRTRSGIHVLTAVGLRQKFLAFYGSCENWKTWLLANSFPEDVGTRVKPAHDVDIVFGKRRI
jgi:hypothetical protein